MAIKWNLVLGKALGTMAEREDEYRKFATDYFTKKYETYSEEKKAWNETTREQKREINKKIDALRAEGLSDTQIANGLNTYGENFFAVVADDLKTYKGSSNYAKQMRDDPQGNIYRKFYSDRFDKLLLTEGQQKLSIEPVVQGLLDKFPEMIETPQIAQSIFGFDYTKGIRDDIKGLSKGTEVPDYDAPTGLTGVSSVLSGTIRDVSPTAMYTSTGVLNREIVNRIKAVDKFKNLKTEPASGQFRSEADQDKADLTVFKEAMQAQNKILRRFEEFKNSNEYIPPSMEGGMTDQQILDRITKELGYGPSTEEVDAGGKGDAGAKGDAGTKVDIAGNISSFVNNNPQSPISKLISQLQAVDGVDDALLQQILSAVASGKGLASVLRGLNLSQAQRNRINNYINDMDEEDKNTISGFSTAPSQTDAQEQEGEKKKEGLVPRGELGPEDIDKEKQIVQSRPSNVAEGELWDSIYGRYFNPDGTAVSSLTPALYNRLVRRYTVALAKMRNEETDPTAGASA